ncbi:MAG: ATP-binding cassette domain-containing protein, partial [Actinomycetota bacterium]
MSKGVRVRMQGLVELHNVTKRFGSHVVVDAMDLRIEGGEFLSLLGPSGCGKSTTLRMIAGLEQPSEGRLSLDGTDITDLPPHKRAVNTVFQSYALFPHLSVSDNI